MNNECYCQEYITAFVVLIKKCYNCLQCELTLSPCSPLGPATPDPPDPGDPLQNNRKENVIYVDARL